MLSWFIKTGPKGQLLVNGTSSLHVRGLGALLEAGITNRDDLLKVVLQSLLTSLLRDVSTQRLEVSSQLLRLFLQADVSKDWNIHLPSEMIHICIELT